jgi:hypothetical protein
MSGLQLLLLLDFAHSQVSSVVGVPPGKVALSEEMQLLSSLVMVQKQWASRLLAAQGSFAAARTNRVRVPRAARRATKASAVW